MTKLKSPTPLFIGFLQATGVFVYIFSLSWLMFNTKQLSGPDVTFMAPILGLLLFATSALVNFLLVFYYPIALFFIRNEKPRAMKVIASTAFFMAFYTLSVILTFIIYN